MDRHPWIALVVPYLVAVALMFTRRPDSLLVPQFYFEDGSIAFHDAHEIGGFRALFIPIERGYLFTLPRLIGWAAQAVPLAQAPLVMNLLALLLGVLPVAFVASRRFAVVLPSTGARMTLALLTLGMPGMWTTLVNTTHLQWHLSLLALLVVVSTPVASCGWRAFDVTITVLSGLTGPMALLLAPVAVVVWWRRRERWTLLLAGLSLCCGAIQIACALLASTPGPRQPFFITSAGALAAVFARRVVLGSMVGEAILGSHILRPDSFWMRTDVTVLIAAIGLAGLIAIALRGAIEVRALLLFGLLILLSAVVWPQPTVYQDMGYWLAEPGSGNRYFLAIVFALYCALVAAAFRSESRLRVAARAVLVAIFALGVIPDWRQPPLQDFKFPDQARRYEALSPGDRMQIVHPPQWSFIVTRR